MSNPADPDLPLGSTNEEGFGRLNQERVLALFGEAEWEGLRAAWHKKWPAPRRFHPKQDGKT